MTRTVRTKGQLREALENTLSQLCELEFYVTYLESKLRALGAVVTREATRNNGSAPTVTFRDWDTSMISNGDFLQEDIDAAIADTRRETLEKVIEALELREYGTGSYSRRMGLEPSGADRFWGDINTALEVREAEKHAEARAATAEKVAGLTKPDTFSFSFVTTPGNFDPAAPKVSDLEPKPKKKSAPKKEAKK